MLCLFPTPPVLSQVVSKVAAKYGRTNAQVQKKDMLHILMIAPCFNALALPHLGFNQSGIAPSTTPQHLAVDPKVFYPSGLEAESTPKTPQITASFVLLLHARIERGLVALGTGSGHRRDPRNQLRPAAEEDRTTRQTSTLTFTATPGDTG